MEEDFELPVSYNGKELLFPAKLIRFGYTYKIDVKVNEVIVSFEKDEESNWRAIIDPSQLNSKIKSELINSIIGSLESL